MALQRMATKATVLREVIDRAFGRPRVVSAKELRRQSLLVSGTPDERDVLEFIGAAFDDRGWR